MPNGNSCSINTSRIFHRGLHNIFEIQALTFTAVPRLAYKSSLESAKRMIVRARASESAKRDRQSSSSSLRQVHSKRSKRATLRKSKPCQICVATEISVSYMGKWNTLYPGENSQLKLVYGKYLTQTPFLSFLDEYVCLSEDKPSDGSDI